MLYFSAAHLPQDFDRGQWDALSSFRRQYQEKGLVWSFTDAEDLRHQFSGHLAKWARKLQGSSANTPQPVNEKILVATEPREWSIPLSSEAKTLLIEAANSNEGYVLLNETMEGVSIYAGEKQMIPDQSPRSVAMWREALDTLDAYGCVDDKNGQGNVFSVTKRGFEEADRLSGK